MKIFNYREDVNPGELRTILLREKLVLIEDFSLIGDYRQNMKAFLSRLGELTEHNKGKFDYIWDIKTKLNCASRLTTFSEHNLDATFHTDSQYSHAPETHFALLCLFPATCGGGINLFLKLEDIMIAAKKSGFNLTPYFDCLFPFATPTVFLDNRNEVGYYKILDFNEYDLISIRYRYDVIREGITMTGSSYSLQQLINNFEKFINGGACKNHISSFFLKRGDLLILSNKELLHARTSFKDINRHLLRIRFNIF